jgi:Tfp pilus assembly protein PilE
MITLGVAAIIAMFAMPVYQQQVMKGHRLDAVAAIYRAAHMRRAREARPVTTPRSDCRRVSTRRPPQAHRSMSFGYSLNPR